MFSLIIKRNLTKTTKQSVSSIKDQILEKLKDKYKYNLIHAQIDNLSWQHDKPKGAETHLKVTVVTTEFESLKMYKRIDSMNKLLNKEIKQLESIDFKLLTPSKWYDSNQRGLKLQTIYCRPPIFDGKLEEITKNYEKKYLNQNAQQQ